MPPDRHSSEIMQRQPYNEALCTEERAVRWGRSTMNKSLDRAAVRTL